MTLPKYFQKHKMDAGAMIKFCQCWALIHSTGGLNREKTYPILDFDDPFAICLQPIATGDSDSPYSITSGDTYTATCTNLGNTSRFSYFGEMDD